MITLALFARFEAKPGKEEAVREFLDAGLRMANQEHTTPIWFALRLSSSTFGVFDAFEDEQGRQAHLKGPIARALMAQADDLFAAARAGHLAGTGRTRRLLAGQGRVRFIPGQSKGRGGRRDWRHD